MNFDDGVKRLADHRRQIVTIRDAMREVQQAIEPQPVDDYVFRSQAGEVRLSQLFGRHRDLLMVHNMGSSCAYCTLWADGYNGVYDHLVSRASFVLSSPDEPDVQARFRASRDWRFPMVSHAGSNFAQDMGYRSESGGFLPGLSVFRLGAGRIVRVSASGSDVRDDFCSLWHLFDLLPEGAAGWQPRFRYDHAATSER